MPDINPDLVPTIAPGNIFKHLTEDSTLNVRWLVPQDPVFYEVTNRPMADIVLRQLIIAKALDAVNLRLGHQALFPFLITAKFDTGSGHIELPQSWMWDMHVSIPAKWEFLRLAKIKRMSGTNASTSGDITGILRFIFTAQKKGSTTEVALFYVDYKIDSFFTYQVDRINPVTTLEEPNAIDPGELETINGFVMFRTLDKTLTPIKEVFDALQPPIAGTDSNGDGLYDTPTSYDIVSSDPGGITNPDDFLASSLPHGTGVVVASAYNLIPATDSDINTWLSATNYPFRIGATRTSIHGITVPKALFREFDMVVPTSDEPTGDVSRGFSPVWLSSIERLDSLANKIEFRFSTHTIGGSSTTPDVVEFARLTLDRSSAAGTVVKIEPIDDLLRDESSSQEESRQGFGTGHVVLSSIWGTTDNDVDAFFNGFFALLDMPPVTAFVKDAGLLSSYGLSRNSRFVPTKGQHDALQGSTARRNPPLFPSDSNRFVTEEDQGLGDAIDFRVKPGFVENEDILPIGYTGSLIHKLVKLVVDASGDKHDYEKDILPRLKCLLGRDPVFGDEWFDGTLLKFFNGDTWQSL